MTQRQQDYLYVSLFVLFIFIIGAISGWTCRVITNKDKKEIAAFEKDLAQRDYYETLIMQLRHDAARGSK